MDSDSSDPQGAECPICDKNFPVDLIEVHVNRCIFLNSTEAVPTLSATSDHKRTFGVFEPRSSAELKRPKLSESPASRERKPSGSSAWNNKTIAQVVTLSDDDSEPTNPHNYSSKKGSVPTSTAAVALSDDDLEPQPSTSKAFTKKATSNGKAKDDTVEKSIPLAEKMRPDHIDDFVGQAHILGKDTILRKVLDKNEVPSMILWGPPGCGKTTLAHIIASRCKQTVNSRFVKLSATMVGVNDVKEVVKIAKNEQKFQRKTILFMDEIHRFNKLQQDIFLPHVESGTITLIGATTENPSFSLNSALLSRCRVIVLEKLEADQMFKILQRSLTAFDAVTFDADSVPDADELYTSNGVIPKVLVERESLVWLAEMCDGDARIALNSLQLAMQSILEATDCPSRHRLKVVSLDAIKTGIKKSHMLYDRKGDQHYDMISALHKSIRASDDNAALYWCTRIMLGGEDPRYICRRMVRAASEDIGLADPQAVTIALSALNAVQLVGMPEADCIIAQCAVYLARAPKSTETYMAMKRCKSDIAECKGPQPSVPLHLRNAPTKLMKELGYGRGYNTLQREESGLYYMPEGMEDRNYF